MNEHFGDWYREADLQPEHETLAKRQEGIESTIAQIDDEGLVELGRLYYGLSESGETRDLLREAMFKADNAFPMNDNNQELRVLAGASLLEIAESSNERDSLISAYSLVCPSLLGERKKLFITPIVQQGNEVLEYQSGRLRKKQNLKGITISKLVDELEKIQEGGNQNNFQVAHEHVTGSLEKVRNGLASVAQRVRILERNQELYQEDSNILWWMTGRYSRDLECPLKELDFPAATIIIGKELADLVQVQPGPVAAKAVLSRCLEDMNANWSEKVTLTNAVNKLPDSWKKKWYSEEGDRDSLSLCPVTTAICHAVAMDGKGWGSAAQTLSGVPANTKLSGLQLAFQMYRECMFRRLLD